MTLPPRPVTSSQIDFKLPSDRFWGTTALLPPTSHGLPYIACIAHAITCFALQPQTSMTIEDASNELLKMMGNPSEDGEECGNHMEFGRFILMIAEQIPYDHPAHRKLVTLINYLQKGNWYSDVFMMEINQNMEIVFETSMDNSQLAAEMNRFVNYNAFLSQIDAHLPASLLSTAVLHFLNAFEMDYEHPESVPNSPGIHNALQAFQRGPQEINAKGKGLLRTATVRVASLWMIQNATHFFALLVSEPDRITDWDHTTVWTRTGQRFRGDRFSRERWKFWKDGFRQVVDEAAADSYLGKEAGDALRAMNVVDGTDASGSW
ncbi:uncharacterized protein AB675_8369 [Cyphellophora attinorum]|uniref:Uncharacterized protein n=1 Tax=Cyphellophora attinorum TaxID=1664694 RepID=A0A0N1P1N7_9EURO|nr:uncharacterized protein AB675_8369 [Phialophora attinorum]KPI44723.1 hypothetical protein AB675_8369 [Phialophora attinorum]